MRVSFLIILLIVANTVFSQYQRTEDGEIPEKEIIIEKNKSIELPNESKNYRRIVFDEKVESKDTVIYDYKDFSYNQGELNPRIRVLMLKEEKLNKLYSGHLRAGFGNYLTPYFEGFYNNKRSKDLIYGVHLKHLSSQNGALKNAGFSNNKLGGNFTKFKNDYKIYSNINVYRNTYNYYGASQEVNFIEDSIKQSYLGGEFTIGVSKFKGEKHKFDFQLPVNYVSSFQSTSELDINPDFMSEYQFSDQSKVVTNVNFSFISYSYDNNSISRLLTTLNPKYVYKLNNVEIEAGAIIQYENDTIGQENDLHLYPDINVSYNLNDKWQIYAGVDGQVEKRSFHYYLSETPFFSKGQDIFHVNKEFDLRVGFRAKPVNKLTLSSYLSRANYKQFDVLKLNEIASLATAKYDTLEIGAFYDGGNSTQIKYHLDLEYHVIEKLMVNFNMDYYNFSLGKIQNAWHKPIFFTNLGANYNLFNKLYVYSEVYFLAGIATIRPDNSKSNELDDIVDINVKFDYRVSDSFSLFLDLYNIVGKEYERYLYYKVKGINILGGLTFTF